jgi:hypothetical protein
MKKAIKKITVFFCCLTAILSIYIYTQSESYTSSAKKTLSEGSIQNEEGTNAGSVEYPSTTISSYQDYGYASNNNLGSSSANPQQQGTESVPTNGNNVSVLDLTTSNSLAEVTTEGSFRESIASNYSGSENEFNAYNSINGYGNLNGPNAGESNMSSSVGGEVSSSSGLASSSNGNTASRVSSNTPSNPSASRVISGNGGSLGFSTPPIIETPGNPGGGNDPYVPIDDYYGLFALLLCGGVIFWYRNKANKLVRVKA